MSRPRKPELSLAGNISENFKNFEMRFNDYCVEADYRDLTKDPATEKEAYYLKPLMEIAALRSSMPDEALQVIRYSIEPEIAAPDKKKPWVWLDRLRAHYAGTAASSLLSDRFTFWMATQSARESVQEWETHVRRDCSLCDYAALADEMSRDKFVFGLRNSDIRAELLKCHLRADNTKKTLNDVVAEAKAIESAKRANQLIGEATKSIDESVNWAARGKAHKDMRLRREDGTCHWCGDKRGPHPWSNCPAKGKTCDKCGGSDHFSRVCLETPGDNHHPQGQGHRGRGSGRPRRNQRGRGGSHGPQDKPPTNDQGRQRSVHAVHTDDGQACASEGSYPTDEYDQQCYSLDEADVFQSGARKGRKYFAHLLLSDKGDDFIKTPVQIDSAAGINTMPERLAKSLFPRVSMSRSPYQLFPYKKTSPVRPLGQISLLCDRGNQYHSLVFQVLADSDIGDKPALLSGEDSEFLGLIKIMADEVLCLAPDVMYAADQGECQSSSKPIHIPRSRRLPPAGQLTKDAVLREYKDSFQGLGYLGPPVHFQMKTDVTPVQMPNHRVPVAKRKKEKEALDRYVALGIMEKVDEPTPWCSNALIKETPKKFRVCIDPSQTVNKALMRPMFQIPTLTEHLHQLGDAKCFSLLDVREGFLHIPLDEESSLQTTMHTTYGRYKWLRLPFGISSAPEEFQKRLLGALEGLEGIICIADDILVYGEGQDYDTAKVSHDRRVVALMERCMAKDIRMNPDKFRFSLKELKFMGNIITDKGMRPDPDKVAAITGMPAPTDRAGLLRFMGMATYLSQFCENLSSTMQPLRMLTKDGASFIWSEVQEDAFRKAKALIASAPTLIYYSLDKPVTLQVDASEKGLGAALLQPNANGELQPISFSSGHLTETEQRYSQMEKECLAICHGLHKFDQWLYGKADITVHTDHKPLVPIMSKPLHKAPARLQRMLMTLQRYRFDLEYRKGTTLLIADTLSRAALNTPADTPATEFEVFRLECEAICRSPRLTGETERDIIQLTDADENLSALRDTILDGWPDDRNLTSKNLRPYWGYRDELSVLNGAIYKGETVLVPQALRTTMLTRIHANHLGADSNYRMAKEVLFWPGMRTAIRDMCEACSTCAAYGSASQKEHMLSLPVPARAWDLLSQDLFAFEGKDYLVTVCHFSDWIEVDELKDTLASTVVDKTEAHFATFGAPTRVHTDNGPQFISKDYADLADKHKFQHTTSSPYYPKGNGRAEAAVKVAKGLLKKSENINVALLLHRNTPQAGYSYSPAQRMLCRRTRTPLPTSSRLLEPQVVDALVVKSEIEARREESKRIYDRDAGQAHTSLSVGDYAYLKPPPNRRGQPWAYGQVIGSMGPRSYKFQTSRGVASRNRVHVRLAAPPPEGLKRAQVARPPLPVPQDPALVRHPAQEDPPGGQDEVRPQEEAPAGTAPRTPLRHVPDSPDMDTSRPGRVVRSPTNDQPPPICRTRTRVVTRPPRYGDYILE